MMRSFKIFFLVVFCFLFSLKALAQISEYYPTEESSSSKYYVKAEVYTHNQTGNNLKTELTIDDSTYVTDKDNTAHNIYFYAENFEDDIRFRVTVYSYDGTSETETIEFSESEIKDGTRRGASDIGAAASLTIYRKAEIKDFSPKRFCINDQDDFNVSLKGDASIGDIKGSIIIERLENSGSEKYSTGIGSLSKSISVSDIVDNYDIPYGEELKVSFHNSYFSFYEENDEFSHKRDLFMLEPPEDISIDFTQPTCHDSKDATITIGNLPHSSEENTLRINLIKYFDEPSIPGENIELNEDEEIEDLYWGNQTTKLFPIDAGQSSITIDQDQLSDYMELTSGYYKIEAFYGDESASSLCSTDDTFYVDEPKPLKLNLNVEDFETSGGGSTYQIPKNGNEITISGSVTGNQNPYTIYYEDENEDENQFVLDETSLGAGDYTFWVDDDKCKSNDTTLSLDEPGSLDVDTNVYYPDCNAENTEDETKKTGSITFTIESGGIPNFYAELIDNGNNDTTTISGINRSDEKTINNLEPGTYTLKIWDKGDPKRKKTSLISKDFTISEPPEMTLTTTPTDVSCNGNSDGEIELNVKNGTASFSYSISENDRSVKFSGKNHTIDSISPDDYKVTVTDNNGCSVSESVSIEEPKSLQISKTDSNAATCKLSDGSLSFKVSGGWSDKKDSVVLEETGMDSEYESWALIEADADNRTVTFNDLSAGDYEVSVTNAGACSTSEDLKVNKHNPLDELSISQTVNESCKGAENAELEIQNSDSIEGSFDVYVGGEEYQVFNDNQIKGLTAQDNVDVSVEETDERACVYTTTMDIDTLGESDQVQFNSNSTTLASCETASDGSITVQGAGRPDGGYKYKIGDQDYTDEFKSQSHSFDGLLPGTFSVSIMDTAGCEVSMDSIVVGYESNPVSVDTIIVNPASCANASDGTITIENIEHTDESSMDFYLNDSIVEEKVDSRDKMSFPGADSSGLSPGTYSLELVDDNNCAYDTTIDVEHNGYQPGFSRTIEEKVACTGKTNGRVSFELEEGDADDFTFEVFDTSDFADPPVETGDVEEGISFRVGGLTDQEYFVEVMDSNGCGDTLDFEMPLIAHSLELFSETVPASCEEVDNGELHVSAKGGFPFEDEAYQFSYKKNDSGNWESFEVDSLVLQNLSEGDYFDIKVEDKYGCVVNSDPLSIPIKENKTEIQEINTQNPACRDSLSGAATPLMQWTPETTGYNYKLFSLNDNYEYVDTVSGVLEENNLAINDLKEGLYNLKVVDSDGCQDDMDFRLKDPEPVSVRPEPNYVRVKGENTGEFNLGLAGGNKKYEIAWSELPSEEEFANRDTVAGSSYTVSGLPAGDYFVAVRDTAHCAYFDGDDWFTGKISIEEPEKELSVVNDTIFDVSCNKFSDGRIDVEVEGGWGGYQYSLDGGESQETGTFDGLTAGEYSVEISDTAGVSVNKTYNVTEPDTLNIFIDDVHDATCPGYANGRVEATVLNGIDKEEGLRYRAENTEDRSAVFGEMYDDRDYRFNELPKGDYELFVTDSNNCVASKTFSIDEPDTVQISYRHNYIRDKGENTGEISSEITKGNGVFDYKWFKAGDEAPFDEGRTLGPVSVDSLYAGDYTLMVRDTAGCVYEDEEWMVREMTIEEPDSALGFRVARNRAVSCFGREDGFLRIKPTGGWGDYRFRLEDGEFVKPGDFENLDARDYSITVRDSAGIESSGKVTVTEPEKLEATLAAQNDVACFGGSDGGFSLDISGGNLSYLVSVDQENWVEGNGMDNLPKGHYVPHVKDTLGCSVDLDTIFIDQPEKISLVSDSVVKSRCENNEGRIFASFEGGVGEFDYAWYKDSVIKDETRERVLMEGETGQNIDSIYSGRYQVVVTDENGCNIPFEFFVGDISDLTIDSIETKDVWCWGDSNGEAVASVSKGNPPYFYTWSSGVGNPSGASADSIPAGNHQLLVSDSKGCKTQNEFEIGTPDSVYYQPISIEHPLCLGGRKGDIEIEGTGGTPGYDYTWDDGTSGSRLSDLDPGAYEVTITDDHNCSSTFVFEMTYERTLRPDIGPDTTICHYDELTLDGGDFSRFKWTTDEGELASSREVSVNEAGNYYLTVEDADQCLGFDTLMLDVSTLEIDELEVTDVTCANAADGRAAMEVHASEDDYDINWPGGSGSKSRSGLSGGDYKVSVENSHGCFDERDFTVDEPEPLSLTASVSNPLCYGVFDGQVSVRADGGNGDYRYQWEHGPESDELDGLEEGKYRLTVSDAKNCTIDDAYDLKYQRTLRPDLGPDITLCSGSVSYLLPGAYEGYSWFLDGENTSNDSILIANEAGSYRVEVSDEDDCLAYDTIDVKKRASELDPEFLTAASVPSGDTLVVVDVTTPKPSGLEWSFSGDHEIVEEDDYFCEVVFKETGVHSVTLSALMDQCRGQIQKQVLVTSESSSDSDGQVNSKDTVSVFNSMEVSPNPTDGDFFVEVDLKDSAPLDLYLVHLQSGMIIEQNRLTGLESYQKTYNVGHSGQFVVFAVCDGDRIMRKVMVL